MSQYNKDRRKEISDFISKLKSNTACADCKKFYHPAIMEYDHLDSSTKFKPVSKLVQWGYGLKEILREIEKCDLVCANCHRMRTIRRRSGELQ